MIGLLAAAMVATAPLLWASMGGLLCERAGVSALSLEAFMLSAAFAAAWGSYVANQWVGLAAGIAVGAIVALIYALLSVTLRANQIVAALALNLLALGGTGFLNTAVFGTAAQQVAGFEQVAIPGLSDLPAVGEIFFEQSLLVYGSLLLVVVTFLFFRYSPWALALHAVGERPAAAEARGISVLRTRYVAIIACGVLAGIGGVMLPLGETRQFTVNMTAGLGYIALAAVIFGGWRPLGTAAACFLFGIADVSQVWANVFGIDIPAPILATAPYVVTLVVLTVLNRPAGPASIGRAFAREQRA